jgi:hypothetical protein
MATDTIWVRCIRGRFCWRSSSSRCRSASTHLAKEIAVPATARGRHAEVAWSGPVQVAGARVSPGDLVVADASGVV